MRRVKTESSRVVFAASLLSSIVFAVATCSTPVSNEGAVATSVTVFEGARLIVGDGSTPIEDAVFIVDDTRFVQLGRSNSMEIPPDAARVDLTGRTVMPAIIDTHVHLRETREELVEDLQRKAYYGVGAVLSLGRGVSDVAFKLRDEVVPNAARYRTVGRGITAPEPGRTEVPFWISTEDEARTAVRELASQNVDMVKIWVDDRNGQFEKLTPEVYGAVIDEAHQHGQNLAARFPAGSGLCGRGRPLALVSDRTFAQVRGAILIAIRCHGHSSMHVVPTGFCGKSVFREGSPTV